MAKTFTYDTKLGIRQIRLSHSRDRWQVVPEVKELTVFPNVGLDLCCTLKGLIGLTSSSS